MRQRRRRCPDLDAAGRHLVGAAVHRLLLLLVPSPGVYDAVKSVMEAAIAREQRMGASIVRLFFHDCFVQVRTSLLLLITNMINI